MPARDAQSRCDRESHPATSNVLSNIERRLGGPSPDEARRALVEEWRGSADALTPLLEAVQKGWIRGRNAGVGERPDEP